MRLDTLNSPVYICAFNIKLRLIIVLIVGSVVKKFSPVLIKEGFSKQIMHFFSIVCKLTYGFLSFGILGIVTIVNINGVPSPMPE